MHLCPTFLVNWIWGLGYRHAVHNDNKVTRNTPVIKMQYSKPFPQLVVYTQDVSTVCVNWHWNPLQEASMYWWWSHQREECLQMKYWKVKQEFLRSNSIGIWLSGAWFKPTCCNSTWQATIQITWPWSIAGLNGIWPATLCWHHFETWC